MGGWRRLDEAIEPSLQPVCSRAQEVVPVAPTPIEVEADDSDHETSDQVTIKPRRSTRMLLFQSEVEDRRDKRIKCL